MIALDEVRRALALHAPRLIDPSGKRQAAVAMLLHESAAGPEVLFIERAQRAGDPWSGQMAFPGGRVEGGDADARAAAERETFEEVGLSIDGAERLGRLDDLEGRTGGRPIDLVISAFVYRVDRPGPLHASEEVENALWVPLRRLHDPAHHVEYEYPLAPGARWPGIVVGHPERHVVWGLTYRFVERFFDLLPGRPPLRPR